MEVIRRERGAIIPVISVGTWGRTTDPQEGEARTPMGKNDFLKIKGRSTAASSIVVRDA